MKPKKLLSLMLATGLEVLPAGRAVLPLVEFQALTPAWAIVFRVAAGSVAVLGSCHAVSAATAIAGSRTVNATVGTPFIRQLATSGQSAHSWSADTAPLHSSAYPLTPGLYLTNRTGKIGGIPTQPATASIKISAWENSGNSGRHISATFTVSVAAAAGSPGITRQPGNLTIIAGQDAALSVAATGVAPMSYQWHRNGTALPGETSPLLAFVRAKPADAGAYSVVVSNVEGAITSSVAVLSVTPDRVTPVLTLASPGVATTTVTSNTVRMSGQARDNAGVADVLILPATGEAFIADGTTNWSAGVDLAPGTNLFRVKAVDFSGNSSTSAVRAIVFVVTSPLTLAWTGGGSVAGATNGQPLAFGRGYTLTATPGAGQLFSNWIGSVVSASNVLHFVMQSNFMLTAQFVPNPFIPLAGNYTGLYFDPANIQHGSAGAVAVTVLPSGRFSASVLNGTRKSGFTGRFDLDGHATRQVARAGTNALTVELNLDLQGGGFITGNATDGAWNSSLTAHRTVFQATANPAILFATNYTLLLPGAADATLAPPGDSFGSMKVDRSGMASLAGALADASPIARKAPVSAAGDWPLYVSLYGGKGSVFGWLRLRPAAEIDLAGAAYWIRPPGPAPKVYTDGFALSPAVQGSVYTPPGTGPVFDLEAAVVGFGAGDLAGPFTNVVALGPNSRVTNASPNRLTLTVTPATGLFAGRVTPPGATRVVPFKGAILQRQGMGGGFFPGTNRFGQVRFGP